MFHVLFVEKIRDINVNGETTKLIDEPVLLYLAASPVILIDRETSGS
jgi:hypothetical protein